MDTHPRLHQIVAAITDKEKTFIQYPNCRIASDVLIGDFSVIGKPSRLRFSQSTRRIADEPAMPVWETIIGRGCYVGAYVIIEEGVVVGELTVIDSNATIESNVHMGVQSYIVHGARICERARIGDRCVVGGFVADNSVIGAGSRVFGMLVHRHENPLLGWDDICEGAPRLGENVLVGTGAQIIGGIVISPQVYVCSGAIVTKDVPSRHVVYGTNKIVPFMKWKGKLRESLFWTPPHDTTD